MAHIMVVDDDERVLQLVEKLMTKRGHRVSSAQDGEVGLEMIAREKPDVVILDLNLPRVDGFEVCRRLKADETTRSIPVIMLTAAYPDPDDARHGFEFGAVEYMVKPFTADILVHNVERLFTPQSPDALKK